MLRTTITAAAILLVPIVLALALFAWAVSIGGDSFPLVMP
jgi:hypothetical protein